MLYLGLMSGTSADGIDAALVEITAPHQVSVRAAQTFVLDAALRDSIIALGQGQTSADIDALGRLDIAIGRAFADAALSLMRAADVSVRDIRAIGSHGQTIRHRPQGAQPFSWQIGCAHVIAERTGIDVVHDFRRRDVAAGGQGAPLVPAFHRAVFPTNSAIVNLGGIANVSLLSTLDAAVSGFDTGPANCLLDAHAERAFNVAFDQNGDIARKGKVDAELLSAMLNDPYFHQAPPKSTGREVFNLAWLDRHLQGRTISAADVQASLLALSLDSITLVRWRRAQSGVDGWSTGAQSDAGAQHAGVGGRSRFRRSGGLRVACLCTHPAYSWKRANGDWCAGADFGSVGAGNEGLDSSQGAITQSRRTKFYTYVKFSVLEIPL
jgi:anhydro-N-acetylmuramic acid kinase